MKTRMFVSILIFVLAILIVAVSCATGKKTYVSSDYVLKELTGTWYNEEYEDPSSIAFPMLVIHSDGSFEISKEYSETTAPSRNIGKYISINEAWTDSKGNIWYQAKFKADWTTQPWYEIGRISNEGEVWELVLSSTDFPPEIDSENLNYRIRYRQ